MIKFRYMVVEKLHFVQWCIFWSTWYKESGMISLNFLRHFDSEQHKSNLCSAHCETCLYTGKTSNIQQTIMNTDNKIKIHCDSPSRIRLIKTMFRSSFHMTCMFRPHDACVVSQVTITGRCCIVLRP